MKPLIPFYIVCFNRINGLRFALEFAQSSELAVEPIILDMGSTWLPFIEYRDSLGLRIEKFVDGVGPRDLWITGVIEKLGIGPFFLSDGDVDYSGLPIDTFSKLKSQSEKYPWFPKVGLALRICDLPKDKEGFRILKWETDNWKIKFSTNVYLNGVDTTIAYYPRREKVFYYRPSLRLAGSYTARHYPWYEREDSYNDEAKFYHLVAASKISSTQAGKLPTKKYRVKHNILLLILFILKKPIKSKLLGKICVELIAFRGKIHPKTQQV